MRRVMNLAESLSLISDYRTRLTGIHSSVASEVPILKTAISSARGMV